jgi:hypothetical protein
MITTSFPELSRTGSPPLRIAPRAAWRSAAARLVWQVADSMTLAVLFVLGLSVALIWIGAPVR